MKIAILSYYSNIMSRGVETWAKNIKSHSDSRFLINIVSAAKNTVNSENWTIKRLLILGHTLISIREWTTADVIVPTNGTFQTLICKCYCWISCKPLVVFGHSGPGADDKWNLWCSPNVFVAFSSSQAMWANKFKLPKTKVIIIPHAVDTKMFFPNSKIKKIVDVLCVAANSPDKQVDVVRNASHGYKLQVVGSGQADEVPFEEMPDVYNRAKIFCFIPKSYEAFGLVYLEAMACNLPVVAPDDSVRAGIVGDAGILIKDNDELTAVIKTTLNTAWENRPREQALKFSWDKTINLYTKLWLSL